MRETTSDDMHIEKKKKVPEARPKERGERQKKPNEVAHPTSSPSVLRSINPCISTYPAARVLPKFVPAWGWSWGQVD